MPFARYGALGATFTAVRALQAISLVAIIGMTANFVAMIVAGNTAPPNVLIGTLSVTCIAVLYCVITYILFLDAILPFLISSGLDTALLIASIVMAVTIGKPLSYLDCTALAPALSRSQGSSDKQAQDLNSADYFVWAESSSMTCYEMKSIWGLSVALCILFSVSSVIAACLWQRQKTATAPKDIEK